jgi:hypothetical protein
MAAGRVRPCLILGGASSLGDDLSRASELVDPADCLIVATNDAGVVWPGYLDAWVTMHPVELPWRETFRRERGHPGGYVRVTHPHPMGLGDREKLADHVLGGWGAGGSAHLATGWALERFRCSRVVLCGVPLDERPHFNRAGPWASATTYRRGWLDDVARLAGRVRSFSGWTAELLGFPDRSWLDLSTLRHVV